MPTKLILSNASCCFHDPTSFFLAADLNYDGLEICPKAKTTYQLLARLSHRFNIPVCSFHVPWWTSYGYQWWMVSGNKEEKRETKIWKRVLGVVENSPVFNLARRFGVPIIIHPGVVYELKELGRLELLKGLEIRLEMNTIKHPLTPHGDDGLQAVIDASQMLKSANFLVKGVIDCEHLALEFGWRGKGDFIQNILQPTIKKIREAGIEVAEAHICDYDPKVKSLKRGGHLVPGTGSMQLIDTIPYLLSEFPNLDLTVEVAPWSIKEFLLIFLGLGKRRARPSIHQSADFIRQLV
ncbi:MAG: hypothetical protein COX39_02285 [Candidatus Nealsonbacteria bacterium CG23_combo_of_CG06-09_8_20_14_all_40_13]|uniref:Xylose isomerase-like TIM barrel domain-containing protein n=1 Tax=Candidatus Nealsonbacteria bacterium CG23_combo_of_CG06-09_8_20_14_all_40_13 TaxID=1974724 RepID=A0A2G9YQL6_9BACT|nr:MAG: hypothetical protein COX39_02285 [Candidatus Nealsonbacteria bacterium CG23_combo_of_CG06-09_8_20_14_all_40_13]PIR70959.1 MAG: hypothetical protein COU44_02250 [Candidatus Nealsonbacteria bacterium CG10_big_fil_rev_8_21_14_0_10_40_24]PIU43291.1 MAG: hypothetical protein COS97_01830 [Candidatus Nealsonbacteria bacterium CG07_land_8_20_14_0_80_40_10]